MTLGVAPTPRVKGYLIQILMLLSINVPVISFGLAMGWVSLASGESRESEESDDVTLVGAAAATFAAGLVGVPLGARALQAGRKPAIIATSAAFGVCWSLKLAGGWGVVAGRLVAGVAGAAAWCISPLLAREMCWAGARGAAVAALVLAHNAGILLMYLAADTGLHHRTVVLCCLALSVVHCVTFLFAPESPAFLAAQGKHKEARASLAWLRGVAADHPSLAEELEALPAPDEPLVSPLQLTKEMLSDRRRRRAFIIALVAVVGQEACGVLTLLQFAERVFVLARDEGRGVGAGAGPGGEGGGEGLASPARHALVLGVVQFVASGAALYLVERVGRRALLIFGAVSTGACLALGAGWVGAGRGGWGAGGALAAAVAADSLGLQPAPYALLADMFHYQYRGCALLLVTVAACIGNAAETLLFPLVARVAGLWAALTMAAAATLLYALFAIIWVPETKGRSPDEIYDAIMPENCGDNSQKDAENCHHVISCKKPDEVWVEASKHCENGVCAGKPDPNDNCQKSSEYYENVIIPENNPETCHKVTKSTNIENSDGIAGNYFEIQVAANNCQCGDTIENTISSIDQDKVQRPENSTGHKIILCQTQKNCIKLSRDNNIHLNVEPSKKQENIFLRASDETCTDLASVTMVKNGVCSSCLSSNKESLEKISGSSNCKSRSDITSSQKLDLNPQNTLFMRTMNEVCEGDNVTRKSAVTESLHNIQTREKQCSEESQCSKM